MRRFFIKYRICMPQYCSVFIRTQPEVPTLRIKCVFSHVRSFWSLALLGVGSQQQEALDSGSQAASGRGDVMISRFPT